MIKVHFEEYIGESHLFTTDRIYAYFIIDIHLNNRRCTPIPLLYTLVMHQLPPNQNKNTRTRTRLYIYKFYIIGEV